MPDREINTKSNKLDKDLTDLFGVLDGGVLPRIKEGLAKGSLTKARFRDLFPDGALVLAVGLTSIPNYEHIVKGEDDQSRALIDEARDRVTEELSEVLKHPVTVERCVDISTGGNEQTVSPLRESFNCIATISHTLSFNGTPDALLPGVRVGFISPSSRLLLDSTLNINDVSFLAETIVKIMTEVMQSAFDLARENRLDTAGGEKLLERLSKMEANLSKAKEFVSPYTSETGSAAGDGTEPSDEAKE